MDAEERLSMLRDGYMSEELDIFELCDKAREIAQDLGDFRVLSAGNQRPVNKGKTWLLTMYLLPPSYALNHFQRLVDIEYEYLLAYYPKSRELLVIDRWGSTSTAVTTNAEEHIEYYSHQRWLESWELSRDKKSVYIKTSRCVGIINPDKWGDGEKIVRQSLCQYKFANRSLRETLLPGNKWRSRALSLPSFIDVVKDDILRVKPRLIG